MKLALMAATAIAAVLTLSPAQASLVYKGITYDLEETKTASPLINEFTLVITGENTLLDTEGGRTGINALAFGLPSGFASAKMISPSSGFKFDSGGLNSSGCDGHGNFFCFDNTAIDPSKPATIPTNLLSGALTFDFEVTLKSGHNFDNYTPAFKIDWVGTKNNYDLVSKEITPHDPPPAVPIPGAALLFGSGLVGMTVLARRRKARPNTEMTA